MKKVKSKTNPYKVNQFTGPDPRQSRFLALYLDPKSETYSNCLQSALSAGYSEEYAKVLVSQLPDWLSEKLNEQFSDKMLKKAERNLNDFLDLKTLQPVVTMIGILKDKDGNDIEKENHNLIKIKADTSKFVTERLGKNKWGNNTLPPTLQPVFLTFVNNPQFINAIQGFENNIKELIANDKTIKETA